MSTFLPLLQHNDTGTIKLCDFGSATTTRLSPSKMTFNQMSLAEEEIFQNTTPQNRTPEVLDMHLKFDINEKMDIWVSCLVRENGASCECE